MNGNRPQGSRGRGSAGGGAGGGACAAGGSASGDVLEALLSHALANIARLAPDGFLTGAPIASRRARRHRFPRVAFYGEQPMKGGLLGHVHDRLEVATVTRGRLFIGIGREIYEARAGDWCVFRPGAPHGECARGPRDPYEVLWFIGLGRGMLLHATSHEPGAGYAVAGDTRLGALPAAIAAAFGALAAERTAPPRLDLLKLVAWCAESIAAAREERGESRSPLVARVRRILDESGPRPPRVSELARRAGVSANYLSSLFHEEVGSTIRRYAEERRIRLACSQLRHSRESIKEIAYALEFSDPHHFSHAFRRVMGMSPSAYRGEEAEIQTPRRRGRDMGRRPRGT